MEISNCQMVDIWYRCQTRSGAKLYIYPVSLVLKLMELVISTIVNNLNHIPIRKFVLIILSHSLQSYSHLFKSFKVVHVCFYSKSIVYWCYFWSFTLEKDLDEFKNTRNVLSHFFSCFRKWAKRCYQNMITTKFLFNVTIS